MLVARDTPLPTLFNSVAGEVARVLGVDAAGVVRYIGAERAVVVGAWREDGKRKLPVNAELDLHRADSALGRAKANGRPARVASYDGARGELASVMKSLGMQTSIATPIMLHGDVWGALGASASEEDLLPPGSEQRLMRLAELVAHAIINDAAREELVASRTRVLEQGDETRRRLERALHEGAHQHVVALALKLRVALGR